MAPIAISTLGIVLLALADVVLIVLAGVCYVAMTRDAASRDEHA